MPLPPFRLRVLLFAGLLLGGCEESAEAVAREGCVFVDDGGGSLSSDDGILTLSVRPGALEPGEEIELCVALSDDPPEVSSPTYRVRPNIDLDVGTSITFTDTLDGDDRSPSVVAIGREAFEAGEGRWLPLPTTRIDPESGLIAASDVRLSMFYGVLSDVAAD